MTTLTGMKTLIPLLTIAAAMFAAGCGSSSTSRSAVAEAAAVGSPADYDALLHKYVKGEFVDYAGWKADAADMARFDAFLRWQGDADVKSMSTDEKIAF